MKLNAFTHFQGSLLRERALQQHSTLSYGSWSYVPNPRLSQLGSSALAQNVFCNGGYRFGFNGMQRDDEIAGRGNSLDFGARLYDSRLGRWMSVDPLAVDYPSFGPYTFVGNTPLKAIDPDGKQIILVGTARDRIKMGYALFQLMGTKEGRRIVNELSASNHKIIIFNDRNIKGNRYFGSYQQDGVTYHEINFNPTNNTPFPIGNAKKGKELERDPSVSLYHELRHAEQKILGISSPIQGVYSQNDKDEVYFDEVDAVYGENLVRAELNTESRDLYEGVQVSGVAGIRAMGTGEYSTEIGAGGSSYQFVPGDYSKKFKTLNNRKNGNVKIETGKSNFKPKNATKGFSSDGTSTTFR